MAIIGLGIGSRVGEQLTRKGGGGLDLIDHDIVAPSNLHRTYFFPEDVGELKALVLARNLSKIAVHRTLLRGFPMRAQDYFRLPKPTFDIAVCLVDDEESREFVGRAALQLGKPCIFGAVSADGNSCRVLVQEPGKACYGCSGGLGGGVRCGPWPAIGDVQAMLAALVVYAIDTLIMPRPRHWNLRQIFLPGGEFARNVERNPDCPICGSANKE